MDLTTFVSGALLGATVYMLVNFVKYLKAGDWNGVLTLLLAMLVGVFVVWLGGQADVTSHLKPVTDAGELGTYDAGSVVLVGIALASTFSVVKDFIAARDNTDSAQKPKLIP